MRTTQQFSITLPHDMAEQVRARVASGAYASESEVIRDGLRSLIDRDRVFEAWLHKVAATSFDRMQAEPGRAIGIDEVRARLAAERAGTADK